MNNLSAIHEVALRADSQGFTNKAEEIGRQAAGKLKSSHRAQVTGLEGIANSALKVSDVFDFVKTRTARHETWRPWGQELFKYLSTELRATRQEICLKLKVDANGTEAQWIYLLLIRAFVHQFAAQYEYSCLEASSHDESN